jgi:3-phosphoshikimate 1-carboxyvinyltransferase
MDRIGEAGGAAGAASPAPRWVAPVADGPVRAAVTLPGSKSMTNRALVLAALARQPGVITGPLEARDTLLMRRALTALGTVIDDTDPRRWQVTPGQPAGGAVVDVGNAGTVMRFVPPVAALTRVTVEFRGDARASERPAAPLLAALRDLGAVIHDGGRGAIPFTVAGQGPLPGGPVTLDASASSQFVSGLLLAAPRWEKGAEIRHRGPRAPSAGHIDMTVRMLRDSGAQVEAWAEDPGAAQRGVPDTWRVLPGELDGRVITVEPDLSNAVPFLAAALVTGGTVTVPAWPSQTAQPARQILALLAGMGAGIHPGQPPGGGLTVTGTGRIHGITADLADCPEAAPVITVLAALACSPSRLTGIAHLRGQETDRLAALATELNALGADVTELADGLAIRPRPLAVSCRPWASYGDHRMVMAAAVLGLVVPGIQVTGAATVGKTFPEFPRLWARMLGRAP